MGFTLPFALGASRKKRTHMMAVDLGNRTTKAVLLERRGELLALTRYALLDAPVFEKKISVDLLADHLYCVAKALGGDAKFIAGTAGISDSLIRQVELPQMPMDEMRQILKMNHKNYMQQDLPNYAFDCYVLPPRLDGKNPPPPREMGVAAKIKVLAAAAKQQLVEDFVQAAKIAGLTADGLVPTLLGPINAFEKAMPEIFAKEAVALVDIGFHNTSVCVLDNGELATNRTISIGGDQITSSLAEEMRISYAEAEGIKVGMAPEIEPSLLMQVTPLGREIRASLDFFEHQNDRPVSQIFVSGATARSEMILQMLNSEIMIECKPWNPTGFLQLALPGQQTVEMDQVGPQLSVAIGTALAVY
jgi:type IV pilus assembly protein PilM